MKEIFLFMSVVVSLITPLIGLRAVVNGEFRPQRVTRFLVFLVSTLFVSSLFIWGERNGLFLAMIQWISSLIFFLISLRVGMGGKNRSDAVVFFLAILVIVIWKTTNNPILALYLSILADFIGFLPTITKSFYYPRTEDPKFYASDMLAGGLNILALKVYNIQNLAFPGYIFLLNTLCFILILIGRKRSI